MLELILSLFALQASPPVHAQARIELAAEQIANEEFCEVLGFSVHAEPEEILAVANERIALDYRIDPGSLHQLSRSAYARQQTLLESENAGWLDQMEGEDQGIRDAIHGFIGARLSDCAAAVSNPDLGGSITVPPGVDYSEIELSAADDLLANFGLASWQTSLVVAQGELMTALGLCRHRVSRIRHDDLLSRHSQPPAGADSRAASYLANTYQVGLDLVATTPLDAAQCERLVGQREQRLVEFRDER